MPVVLTIDDEQAIRQSFRHFLEDYDYHVLEAENGRVGLTCFIEAAPDLVMVDLRMPEVDGLDVLAEVRRISPDTPVIVISGTGVIADAVEALRLGAWDFLMKPVKDLTVLLHTVERCLERSRLIQENRAYQQDLEAKVHQRTQELADANQGLTMINARLRRIVESTRKISGVSQIDQFGAGLLTEFRNHMNAAGGSIYLVGASSLQLLYTLDANHPAPEVTLPLKPNSVFQHVFQERQALLIQDINKGPFQPSGRTNYEGSSALVFPLSGEGGKIAALLSLHSRADAAFLPQDKEIGTILASYSAAALNATRSTQALRSSERHLKQVLEENPVPIILATDAQTISYCNRTFHQLFGYSPDDMREVSDFWGKLFPDPAYREEVRACWCHAFTVGRNQATGTSMGEWRCTASDGSVHHIEMKLMPMDDFFVATLHDITERKMVETRIRQINRELEDRVRERSIQLEAAHAELVENAQRVGMANIATGTLHNIGNILNSVNVSIEELENTVRNSKINGLLRANKMIRNNIDNLGTFFTQDPRGKLIPEYFKELGDTLASDQHMLEEELHFLNTKVALMRDVMETQKRYADIDQAAQGVPVVDLIEDALRLQMPALARQNVAIERHYIDRPFCLVTKIKLMYVLNQVLINALEAMTLEGRSHTISITVSQNGPKLANIEIADTGHGIVESNLKKIFAHGFSTRPGRSGFGLHTCANLMTEMGGKLSAISEGTHTGAILKLTLPVFKEAKTSQSS